MRVSNSLSRFVSVLILATECSSSWEDGDIALGRRGVQKGSPLLFVTSVTRRIDVQTSSICPLYDIYSDWSDKRLAGGVRRCLWKLGEGNGARGGLRRAYFAETICNSKNDGTSDRGQDDGGRGNEEVSSKSICRLLETSFRRVWLRLFTTGADDNYVMELKEFVQGAVAAFDAGCVSPYSSTEDKTEIGQNTKERRSS